MLRPIGERQLEKTRRQISGQDGASPCQHNYCRVSRQRTANPKVMGVVLLDVKA